MISPEASVADVPGVGLQTAKALGKAFGIVTVRDLVEHYPRRHQDLGARMDLSEIIQGEPATLVGHIRAWNTKVVGKKRLKISEAIVDEVGGGTFMISYFNQPWKATKLRPGTRIAASGTVKYFGGTPKIDGPELEVMGPRDEMGQGDRLQPIYAATEKIPSWKFVVWLEHALELLPPWPDHLPMEILDEHDLIALDDAYRWIHRPPDKVSLKAARKRLRFDELFTLQTGLCIRRHRMEQDVVGFDNLPRVDGIAKRYLDSLPFEPTGAQRRAFEEIGVDLGHDRPMHRLLQGDVGSGKTIVAIWSMLCAVDAGRQGAMMVPTEVLAEQHHRTLLTQLAPLGVNVLDGVRVELLTSSTPAKARRRILSELLTGQTDIVVGTHALLEEGVRFAELGVVVIDEQHRFGVEQRIRLKEKSHEAMTAVPDQVPSLPDVLTMTATPIPRSIALTAYGDLDVTILDELPPGRQSIITTLITPEEVEAGRRERLYDFVRKQVAQGLQAYVVCPLVEPSSEMPDVEDATTMHRLLADQVFTDLTVALVHGRLKSEHKEAAMTAFRAGTAQILVATTVIEVGVDVPQASVMIIENADRFGISQLHQLRGRVGRGNDKAYCVLFADPGTDDSRDRLMAIIATTDGFVLA
ncbi:MAG: ATP-dependent DNA helicase RecG, partial [Glaciecola sp.]